MKIKTKLDINEDSNCQTRVGQYVLYEGNLLKCIEVKVNDYCLPCKDCYFNFNGSCSCSRGELRFRCIEPNRIFVNYEDKRAEKDK